MTDIVERLRESANALQEHIDRLWRPDIEDIRTAAAEIERLRKTLREIEDSSNDPRAVREARAALGGKP